MKIGVFDSGVGGMTVLSELRQEFGAEEFVYLGDTANLPYGTKSAAQVKRLSADCALKLKAHGVSIVVVACNTASSLALDEIRDACGPEIRVIGVVEPGVSAAVEGLKSRVDSVPVLVLATRATIRSGLYGKLLREKASLIFEQACPLLVPIIEEGWTDHPILHQTIAEYVRVYREQHPVGVALLGCTHYPWIQSAVQSALPGWHVVNSAKAIVRALQQEAGLKTSSGNAPVKWIFTDPDAIPEFARRLYE